MRPTGVILNGPTKEDGKRILMFGGNQDRSSQCYSMNNKKWSLSPKLPLGHNITTNIVVNFNEKACFTFIIDAQLTIKSAVLDLEACIWTDQGTENTSEMDWAMQWSFDDHKIDRLHLKTAVQVGKDLIAVVGRGKPEDVRQQIIGIILFFKPTKGEDGKWKIQHVKTQKVHASVFPR